MIPGLGQSAGEGKDYPLQYSWTSLVAQVIKNLLQCGRPGFDPWVGMIPWRRERLLTPVFWPGEFHGLYSPWGHKELDVTEQLSHHIFFGLFHSPSVECSTANCDFGALTGGDKCLSFYSAILENDDLDSGTLNRGASPVAQMVKNLAVIQETLV